MSPARRLAILGMLVGISLVLFVVEGLFPQPFPFLKVGLANIVTLFALFTLGARDAIAVTALRVVAASFLAGTLLGPAFALSLGGGLSAAVGMAAAARFGFPPLGVVGVSMIGAASHNLAQLGVVGALYGGGAVVGRLLPAALLLSAGAGVATGLVARFALNRFGGLLDVRRGAIA